MESLCIALGLPIWLRMTSFENDRCSIQSLFWDHQNSPMGLLQSIIHARVPSKDGGIRVFDSLLIIPKLIGSSITNTSPGFFNYSLHVTVRQVLYSSEKYSVLAGPLRSARAPWPSIVRLAFAKVSTFEGKHRSHGSFKILWNFFIGKILPPYPRSTLEAPVYWS